LYDLMRSGGNVVKSEQLFGFAFIKFEAALAESPETARPLPDLGALSA